MLISRNLNFIRSAGTTVALGLTVFLSACNQDAQAPLATVTADRTSSEDVAYWPAPPMIEVNNAYQAAQLVSLRSNTPEEHNGLHNVYHLSSNIISGSEPHGVTALKRLAAKGIRSIISVDGKVPDADAAHKLGMRYAHIPIQYNGISPEQMLLLAKAFREMPAPFYVHCFHGRHRGPAAAAIGRIARDGTSREQALAEMRQWCGTSPSYSGLFQSVASQQVPPPEATEALKALIPEASPLTGFRQLMIEAPRSFDRLKALNHRGWTIDPAHPDVDPVNEATILLDLFRQGRKLDETATRPDDFRHFLDDSVKTAASLQASLIKLRDGEADAAASASFALKAVKQSCNACHKGYRN